MRKLRCSKCNAAFDETQAMWDRITETNKCPECEATGLTDSARPGSETPLLAGYHSTYNTARSLAQLISGVDWLVVAIGGLLALFLTDMSQGTAGALVAAVPSLAVTLGGFLLVSTGQLTRAAVDTADHTGAILAVLRVTAATRQ